MTKQSKPKFKSVFILHVYKYGMCEPKVVYHIDKEELERKGCASPGIDIWDYEVGYFQTLRAAEKRIKKIASENQERLYSFLVKEKPQDCMIRKGSYLSVRRYLKDGSLWQVSKVSSIRDYDGIDEDLGNTGFYGRDLKTIPFKEGDIVEIAYDDFVELAIIWSLPATKKRMKVVWNRYRRHCSEKVPRVHPDDSDDGYAMVEYSVAKDGKISFGHTHPAVVNVLPPSFSVPQKYARQLRRCLKTLQKDIEDCVRNRENEQQNANGKK